MSGVPRVFALAQANAMLAELETIKPGTAARLADDAQNELTRWDDLVVRLIPEAQTNPKCSVAGAYIADGHPPVLAIATSTSPGRRQFTALHELGHHLQQSRTALMEPLLDQPDSGFVLEDAACNSFAAMVLLPTERVDRHIGRKGPTPGDVAALWQGSAASRAAACVRASERLPSPGHVLLLNPDGTVAFDGNHGLPPVRRGADQSQIPVVRDALVRPQRSGTGHTRLVYRDGILGDELYIQVADMGGYAVAVLVTDHAPWEKFSPPPVAPGPKGRWWTCERCGELFETFGSNCETCHVPKCKVCGCCNCQAAIAERVCTRCFLTLPAAAFVGASVQCKDCS